MLSALKKSPRQKRQELRKALKTSSCLRFVGSFSPPVSVLIEELAFEGLYVSGAAVAAMEGRPDIGLITLNETADRAESLTRVSALPSLVDGDTGFGGALNVARLVEEMENRGLSGLHIEDQENPKRCGHLDDKRLIPAEEMIAKIQSAVKARRDENFLIVARTDAFSVEGRAAARERAEAYGKAGADMIFPEALPSVKEFEIFRERVSLPLMANMTEFGKTDIIQSKVFEKMGYNIVIYPVSALRFALHAAEKGLRLLAEDRQKEALPKMQTRSRLYELLRYNDYRKFDREVLSFQRKDK